MYDISVCQNTLLEVYSMAADALVIQGARSSAEMLLNIQNKWVFVFHKEGF